MENFDWRQLGLLIEIIVADASHEFVLELKLASKITYHVTCNAPLMLVNLE